jgi:hypothetical protein
MPRRHGLAMAACIAAYIAASTPLFADIIFLKDGTVLIGTLVDASGTGLRYESFGKEREIDAGSVLDTLKELSSVTGKPFDVVLTDGSVFTGSIADYDPEIGLFLDLSIGALTIPSSGIADIVDTAQRRRWVGSDLALRAAAYGIWPLANEDFGISFAAGVSADARLPARGLTAGAAATWSPLDYKTSAEVEYNLLSVVGRIGYRLLGSGDAKGPLARLSPFAYLGAGAVYIGIKDSRPGASSPSSGGMAPCIAAELGVDFAITQSWSIRLSCRPDFILQSDGLFSTVGAGLSLAWENDI